MRNDKLQKAKALDELFASRLEKLLIRLRSERVITFESDAVMRGYLLAEEPSGDRTEEYRAYMNLRYTALVVRCQTMSVYTIDRTTSTIKARDYKGGAIDAVVENNPKRKCVRRLTPLECCRLQGFPDGWGVLEEKDSLTDEEYAFWTEVRMTHARISGKKLAERTYNREQMLKWYNSLHSDSAEYKMWGNGIALPCAEYVMQGISEC